MGTLTCYRQPPDDGFGNYSYGYHFWYSSPDNGSGGPEDVGGTSACSFGVGQNGGVSGINRTWRGAVKFDISGLPGGVVINSAIWNYYIASGENGGGSYNGSVYLLAGAFDGSQVYSAQPGVGSFVGTIADPGGSAQAGSLDITSAVSAWYAGTTNYGLKVVESGSGQKVNTLYVSYGGGSSFEMYLVITYNYPPTTPGSFTFPVPGSLYVAGTTLAVAWGNSTDTETATGSLTYQLDYWNGYSWVNLTTTAPGVTSYNWNTTGLSTNNYQLRVRAYDGTDFGSYRTLGAFTIKVPQDGWGALLI